MKIKNGLLLGVAFTAGILAGPGATVIERGVGFWPVAQARAQTASDANSRADTYKLLTLFGDVFERIRAEYVEPVNDRELIENAINGMLTGLDPHSSYMNAKAFRDMQVQTRGEFGGLGLEVQAENGLIKVVSPIDDTPAAKAGVKPGDLITMLDGQTVQGLTLAEAVDKMRGPPGSPIKLTIKREGIDTPIDLSMNREVIHIQVAKSHLEGGRYRLRAVDLVQRADRPGTAQGGDGHEGEGGGAIEGPHPRSAQQSGRLARPGGRRVGRFPGPG